MKMYPSATEALIAHLRWLKSKGELNCDELARRMVATGVPLENRLNGSMFRMLASGRVTRIIEDRALAACRMLGIQIMVVDNAIPDSPKAPS
jgi:hypothetical protein